jgi:ABC-type nickel/cobalt efflux system permease component RcnA
MHQLNAATDFAWFTTLALGFVLGLRHATEPDHVAAVSTFSTREKDPFRAIFIGAFWGMGHTAALMVFGMAIALLRLTVSDRMSHWLDFAVGIMLIILGVNVLVKFFRQGPRLHRHVHEHDGVRHSHFHFHASAETEHQHEHAHHHHNGLRAAGEPFVVGVIHGLAGTAAVMLLFVSTIPSLALAAAYLLVFGLGTILCMMAMSFLMGLPAAYGTGRAQVLQYGVQLAAGLFSLGFGMFLAWDVGLIQAVLRG